MACELHAGYLVRERALADLPCTGDEHDPCVGERVQHQRPSVTGKYMGGSGHQQLRQMASSTSPRC
jgi:hypothetical protein